VTAAPERLEPEMPKVLHFRQSSRIWGPERVILDLCRSLPAQGFGGEIAIMYPRRAGEPPTHPLVLAAQAAGISIVQVPAAWTALPGVVWWLRRELIRGRFAILHTHEFKTTILGAFAARLAMPAVSLVATDHSLFTGGSWRMQLFRALEIIALHAYRCVTVPAASQRQRLSRFARLRRITRVVPEGIDADLLCRAAATESTTELRTRLGVPDGVPVIAIVGRLEPQKGHRLFIQSAARVLSRRPETRFWIVGDGPLRTELESCVAAAGIAAGVAFLGYRADVPTVLRASDALALASLDEALPQVILEALALGTPVVAPRVGGIADMITDGETGVLVAPRDPEALAAGMLRLIENPAYARALGARGPEIIAERFGSALAARQMAAVYREVLACKP
jgi:glycosyltransferase involved in cell wall biosynthesis